MHYRSGYLAIFLLAVATAVVVLWYSQQTPDTVDVTNTNLNNAAVAVNNANVAVNTNTNAPADTTATENPTADWKTYTNTKHGYSMRYPQDWTLSGSAEDSSIWLRTPESIQKEKENVRFIEQDGLIVSFYESINDESARGGTTISDRTYTSLEDFLSESNVDTNNLFVKKVGETTLGGEKAYEVHVGGIGQSYAVMAERNGIYQVMFPNAYTKEVLTELQKQVLATFEFTK